MVHLYLDLQLVTMLHQLEVRELIGYLSMKLTSCQINVLMLYHQ